MSVHSSSNGTSNKLHVTSLTHSNAQAMCITIIHLDELLCNALLSKSYLHSGQQTKQEADCKWQWTALQNRNPGDI